MSKGLIIALASVGVIVNSIGIIFNIVTLNIMALFILIPILAVIARRFS